MKIDIDWLNRIGIILNFLAGFMLAPDLIGRDRILKFEENLEERINRLIINIRNNLKIYTDYISRNKNRIRINITIFIVIIFLLLTYLTFKNNQKVLEFFLKYMNYIIGIFISIVSSLNFPQSIVNFFIKFLRYIVCITNKLERFIRGDDTVLKLITFWGIIFFILGNLLQFIASFK